MKLFIPLLALFLLGGCLKTTPITNREQIVFISPDEESKLGESSYKEILAKSKMSTDKSQIQRIKRIGQKIAIAADRKDFAWEFNLVEDAQVNAFCLPGGKVVVYTGILAIAKNDDQLATVMSHEIAHALAHHGAERMSHQQISSVVQGLGSVLVKGYAPEYSSAFDVAYSTGVNVGIMLPFSRSHENEADAIGVHLMKSAGYNIHESIKFWENMKKLKNGESPNSFFSTHPSDDERIKNISLLVKELEKQK